MSVLDFLGIRKMGKKPIYFKNNSGVSSIWHLFTVYRLPVVGIVRIKAKPDIELPCQFKNYNLVMDTLRKKWGVNSIKALYCIENSPLDPVDISDDMIKISIDQVSGISEIYSTRQDSPEHKTLLWSSKDVVPEVEKAPVHKHKAIGAIDGTMSTIPLQTTAGGRELAEQMRWVYKLTDKGIIRKLSRDGEIVWARNLHYGNARAGKALDKIYHELLLAGLRDKVSYHRNGEGKSTKLVWIGGYTGM